jgi:flotillin
MGKAVTMIDAEDRPRSDEGWRSGKPVEDPQKTKSWGLVTAKPSEYLIHCRGGRVRAKSSGQGATCFKLPWDSVSVIPTSLQRLSFRADQVTRERVGVELVGLAVYRIADPLLAFRVLNFSYPERAQEKLESTLASMLVGATRRLVANLSVDDVLQKRKRAVAGELLNEVAPVIGGIGRPDDDTDRGWGVVLDTIEVQEVRVLSERVFSSMQAPFRAELELKAKQSQGQAELVAVEAEKEVQAARSRAKSEIDALHARIAREQHERQSQARIEEQARKRAEAEARLEVHDTLLKEAEAALELDKTQREADDAKRRTEAQLVLAEGAAATEVARQKAEVEQLLAAAHARRVTAENMPHLAAAVGQRIGEVKVTQIGSGGDNPYGSLLEAIGGVVDMVRTS